MRHFYLNREKITAAFSAHQITEKEKEELLVKIRTFEKVNKITHSKTAKAS